MPPSASDSETDRRQIERQLKLFKFLALALVMVIVFGAAAAWYFLRVNQPVEIVVDGEPVTTVRNARDADDLLSRAEINKVGPPYTASDIVRLQQIRLIHPAGPISMDTDQDALQKLSSALKVHVRAYMIYVDNHPSIALATESDASDTIAAVKDHYVNLSGEGELIGDPRLLSKVKIERIAVTTDCLRASPADAAPYFWTPTAPKVYTVKSGDRGVSIARKNHISLTDLILANPQINLNRLRIGDSINVQKTPLLLKVAITKQVTDEEPILPHVPASAAGKRRVTYTVSYLNGQEVSRDATSMTTLVKPAVHVDIM